MPIYDITSLPPAPNRQQSPEAFVLAADKHVASLTVMVKELNTAFDQVDASVARADADAVATATDRAATRADRAAAQTSAELAAAYAGAAAWSAPAVYPADAVVYSPSDRMLYRRRSAGSSATDPAADRANWASVILAVAGNAVWHAGNFNPADYLPIAGGTLRGALTVNGVVQAAGGAGFVSTAYVVDQRNPIWRFGNADAYGLSYFQGSAGWGGDDSIGIHFGTPTAAGSKFTFRQNGDFYAAGGLYAAGGKVVWHAGNFAPANYAPLQSPTFPGQIEVQGPSYFRGNLHVLNSTENGWWNVIDRNGGSPIVSAATFNVAQNGRLSFNPNGTWGGVLVVGGDGVNGLTRTDKLASVVATNGTLHLDPGVNRGVFLNWHSGSGVVVGNGSGAQVAAIDVGGNMNLSGALTVSNGNAVVANRYTVANASPADSISGTAPWYGVGYVANLFGNGGNGVHLAGYYGLRMRSADATLDVSQGGVMAYTSPAGSYGMLQLFGTAGDAQEISIHFRASNEARDGGWTVGRYSDRFFWYKNSAQRMGLFNDGTLGVSGRIFGNDVNRAGNGLGRITVSTGTPSGGAQGDIWVMY